MSLRNQLLAVFALLFMAVLMVIFWVSLSGTRQYLEEQLSSHAQDTATALSVNLSPAMAKGDLVLAEAQVASLFDRGYFKRIEVQGTDRRPLVQKLLPEKIEGVPEWFVNWNQINTPSGEAFVGAGWKQLGKVLVVSQPTFAYQHLWRTSIQLLAWLLGIWGAALGLLLLLLHFILKPLRAIEKTALSVQSKRFVQIAEIPRAPELASVVTAMNQMSRRVGDMLEAETAKAEALHQKAYQDDITGLVNRRGYELRLVELLQGEYPFELGAVVALELDDMRLLQRAHGFPAGAQILKIIADLARKVFEPLPMTILARSNEFSFSFVLANVQLDQVQQMAKSFRLQLEAQLSTYAPAAMTSRHLGLTYFQPHDERTEVFARVDMAVESARHANHNGLAVLPDAPVLKYSLGSQAWRNLIQSALTENRWWLLRQPVVDLRNTDRTLQLECMARLLDDQNTQVPAAIFMPMALRHRLMPEVDKAMVSLALQLLNASATTSAPDPDTIAINLSLLSMTNEAFMGWFAKQLSAFTERGKRLAVEVTEFAALRNTAATLRLRDLVRSHKGQLGIDHFGLDLQTLPLMRDVLPDYVKLSGYLLTENTMKSTEQALLKSIVDLAHSLDIQVIAQQVERPEQVATLLAAGVDAGQGYFFSAPY